MYRQGDVLIIPVRSIPEQRDLIEREDGRVIVARGEVTGHAHAIADERSAMFRDPRLNLIFLRTDGDLQGPIVGQLLEINRQESWFLAQTDLRKRPVKFALAHASIEDGVIECGTFTLLDHEEHNPQAIPNGLNRIFRQREYTPEEISNVAD
jgi:hypothetical protein